MLSDFRFRLLKGLAFPSAARLMGVGALGQPAQLHAAQEPRQEPVQIRLHPAEGMLVLEQARNLAQCLPAIHGRLAIGEHAARYAEQGRKQEP